MKPTFRMLLLVLLFAQPLSAQHGLSFDLAAIRNTQSGLNGINVSLFNHVNEKLAAGIEINTFFPAHYMDKQEEMTLTGLDIDLNLHYLVKLDDHFHFYPIAGISHTLEKEYEGEHLLTRESFWSFNTGAGLQVTHGRWIPHIEYLLTWGHLNQQFILAGVGFEIKSGKHRPHPRNH